MPHHQVWIDALVTGEDSSMLKKVAGPNTAILAPRGSGKSTWYGMFVAWVLGHNPDCQIIYCSYSESVALSRSRLIQRIISSDRYRQTFPEILPGKRWSASDWEIDKRFTGITDLESDYSLLAVGAGGSITSKRSKLIIIDDPVRSSESIENPDIREKLVTNWEEVLRPTLIPGGRVIVVGTRFRADDLFATTFTRSKDWELIEQSAIIENPLTELEESYWPERYPLEDLIKMRDDSPISFSFQFQNVIVRTKETSIDPKWIIRGEVETDVTKFDSLVIGADLSSGLRETNDWTVFTLGGRIGQKFYILDVVRGRWSGNAEKITKVLEMCFDWGILEQDTQGKYKSTETICYYCVENTAYQSSMAGDWRHHVHNEYRIYNIIYRPAQTKGDKMNRLKGITGLFESGCIVFNQFRPMSKTITELTHFGSAHHDDTVDSLVYCISGLAARSRLDAA